MILVQKEMWLGYHEDQVFSSLLIISVSVTLLHVQHYASHHGRVGNAYQHVRLSPLGSSTPHVSYNSSLRCRLFVKALRELLKLSLCL